MINASLHQHIALSSQLLAFLSRLAANGYELTATVTEGAA